MTIQRPTLMDPPIEELLDKVDSKFTLVALGAMRARQINSYYNSLGQGIGAIVPPQVTSVSNKSLSISFQEIAEHRATYHRPTPEELAAEARRGRLAERLDDEVLLADPFARPGPGGSGRRLSASRRAPRVVLGVSGRHRRLQGRRGLPAADRRGLRGRPGAHRGRDVVRRTAHLHRPRRPARQDVALRRRRTTRSRTPGSAGGPTSSSSPPRRPTCSRATRRGIANDLLTATLLATAAPVVVCPAMHAEMWEHPSVRDNLDVLVRRGVRRRRARVGTPRGRRRGPGPAGGPRARSSARSSRCWRAAAARCAAGPSS